MVFSKEISYKTAGQTDIHNITGDLQKVIGKSGIKEGILCASVVGSTASITTLEYEPALVKDLQALLEKLVPSNKQYAHDATWGDANGYSHLRSAILGTSQSFPVSGGEMVLGTWQQVILIELDHRPRERRVFVQIVGD